MIKICLIVCHKKIFTSPLISDFTLKYFTFCLRSNPKLYNPYFISPILRFIKMSRLLNVILTVSLLLLVSEASELKKLINKQSNSLKLNLFQPEVSVFFF